MLRTLTVAILAAWTTLASAAAIVAALLPIALFGANPGLEIVQSTALVIIGGLATSTLVTLFVVPAIYLAIGAAAAHRLDLSDAAPAAS